jgi:hypothetical protein
MFHSWQIGPSADLVAGLDAARSVPDEFAVVGRDIYLNLLWRGEDEADECLLRFEVEDREHDAELADGIEAGRDVVVIRRPFFS